MASNPHEEPKGGSKATGLTKEQILRRPASSPGLPAPGLPAAAAARTFPDVAMELRWLEGPVGDGVLTFADAIRARAAPAGGEEPRLSLRMVRRLRIPQAPRLGADSTPRDWY